MHNEPGTGATGKVKEAAEGVGHAASVAHETAEAAVTGARAAAAASRPDTFPPEAPAGTKMDDLVKETGHDDKYVFHGKVKVAKELDADWVKAQQYLGKSPEAINSLNDLVNGSKDLKVEKITDGNDRFSPSKNTVYWDPNSAMVNTDGSKQTAANGLLHEQGHANEYKNHPDRFARDSSTPVPGYDDKEEERNIKWEQKYSKELGEGIRHDHRGQPFDAKGPTSLEPARSVALNDPGDIRKALGTARTQLANTNLAVPPEPGSDAGAIVPWDGKSHSGPVVHLDANTVAQAVTDPRSGQTQYQVYDVNKDLGGQMPPEGGARTTILENGRVAGQHAPEVAQQGQGR
jgi:hypothetical protein